MDIRFTCPSCGAKLALSEQFAGGEVRCPKCGTTSTAPASGPAAPTPVVAGPKPAGAGPQRPNQHRCPACGELYEARSSKCPHCNEWFDDAVRAKHGIAPADSAVGEEGLSIVEWLLVVLCSGIGCIVGIVYLCQGNPKGKKMFLYSIGFAIFWAVVQMAAKGGRF